MPAETTSPQVVPLGDCALLVEFGTTIHEEINARALAFAAEIEGRHLAGVRDVVPAYASVAIHFDPLRARVDDVRRAVDEILAEAPLAAAADPGVVEVPCAYGGDAGPDVAVIARWAGCSAEEVVARHVSRVYRVHMIGFLPGFPYMAEVDPSIAMPRRDTPRPAVPAGSVAIAGRQTGIYPVQSPGGWRIVGRTPLRLFDAGREPAATLRPGMRVRFVPIDHAVFESAGAPR